VLEVNGEISLLLYPEGEIKPGLPVWSRLPDEKTRKVPLTLASTPAPTAAAHNISMKERKHAVVIACKMTNG